MKALGYVISIVVPLIGFVYGWTEWAACPGRCPESYEPFIVWPFAPMFTVALGFMTIAAFTNLLANEIDK